METLVSANLLCDSIAYVRRYLEAKQQQIKDEEDQGLRRRRKQTNEEDEDPRVDNSITSKLLYHDIRSLSSEHDSTLPSNFSSKPIGSPFTPYDAPDDPIAPSLQNQFVSGLKKLAPLITKDELTFLTLNTEFKLGPGTWKEVLKLVSCCERLEEELSMCLRCQGRFCKFCSVQLLERCVKTTPNTSEKDLPPLTHSLLARRVESFCSSDCIHPFIQRSKMSLRPRSEWGESCACTQFLMNPESTPGAGTQCLSCFSLLKTKLRKPNTRVLDFGDQGYLNNYICACGKLADPLLGRFCRFCEKICSPVRVNKNSSAANGGNEGFAQFGQNSGGAEKWNNERGFYYSLIDDMDVVEDGEGGFIDLDPDVKRLLDGETKFLLGLRF